MPEARPSPVIRKTAPHDLVRSFIWTGTAAVLLFAGGMAWLLSGFIETRLLQRDAELSRDFIQSLVETQQVAGSFLKDAPPSDPAFTEFAQHLAALPDVLRANVYATSRSVLWSSRPELIGQRFADNDELDEALRGEALAHFADSGHAGDTKAEHQWLGLAPREFVENYLPVLGADGRVLGVVELYRRPVALTDALHSGHLRIWLGAALGGGSLILALLWFVRRIDRSLREQQSRLVDNEALAMVGELSAAVAHNIRNPLGSIRSEAELQRELPDTPMRPEVVIRHVDRIEHLVRTLLTSARDPQERAAHCDAARALAATRERFEPELQAQHCRLVCDWPEPLGEVPIDEVLLAQTLSSVMANAVEVSNAGHTLRLSAERDAAWLTIHVDDEGPGIPDALRHRVAQPFFTTKPRGLGLGLSLARRVLERAGGELTLSRRHPGGTRVSLRLPLVPRN